MIAPRSRGSRRGLGSPEAAIGFTVKSGWASAVLLAGSPTSPHVVESGKVDLSDPAIPESRQPYHASFGTARENGPELARLIAGVKRFGRRSVTTLIRQRQAAHKVRGAGLVVGSLVDPATIANDHIRIHALEGQLFRTILQDAAARHELPCSVWRERDLYAFAADRLKLPEATIRQILTTLGHDVDGPWRAEQKSAALAAWLVMADVSTRSLRKRRSQRS